MSSPTTRLRTLATLKRYPRLFWVPLALLVGIGVVTLLPRLMRVIARSKSTTNATNQKSEKQDLARLSESVSVRAAGRGNPTINLSDGHGVLTAYAGPDELQQALAENQSDALSLASADFDEDGVPDLVSGYGYQGRGILSVLRGNVDAIYPNAPEAQQRRASGTFTDAPFLSPARLFQTAARADFVGAGDFDGDSHWDVVVASRNSDKLYLLSGDGYGGLVPAREIRLPGFVTAFVTGEINRRDGLTDLVVGVDGTEGPSLLVFEGPQGALRSQPETFSLTTPASALALGQLDDQYEMDLAVATGRVLKIIHGRDRKLSLGEEQRAVVKSALIDERDFPSDIKSLTLGNFAGDNETDIGLLLGNGNVEVLSAHGSKEETEANAGLNKKPIGRWSSQLVLSGRWPEARSLAHAHLSVRSVDDLVILGNHQIQVLTLGQNSAGQATPNPSSNGNESLIALDLTDEPQALLSMRLNSDALSDLIVLDSGHVTATVIPTQAAAIFTVNSNADTDDGVCNAANCTLREAINAANANAGADTINFSIGTGAQTIILTSDLFLNSQVVTVDGTTQPGPSGAPLIEVRGNLSMFSSNSLIRGLVIRGLSLNSPSAAPASGNIIERNYVGTDLTGTIKTGTGIVINGPINNLIGGTTAQARNIIAGGVSITSGPSGSDGRGNMIVGNYIGTDVTGTVLLGGGISISSGSNHVIGGTTSPARNVVEGITFINSNPVTGSLVQGNFVGTNAQGTQRLGGGIRLNGNQVPLISSLQIGGTTASARNVISDGISLEYEETVGNQIQGNYIGVNVTGSIALGNPGNGVQFLLGAHSNTVGGTTAGAGNVISGNGGAGVLFGSVPGDETPNYVIGNFIGCNGAGTQPLGNGGDGVTMNFNGNGSMFIGPGNVISNNLGNGISITVGFGSFASNVSVTGNYIGTDTTGTLNMGNKHDGVFIGAAASQNTTTGNVIAFNLGNGINIPDNQNPSVKNVFDSNSIFSNQLIGINLGAAGVTANDDKDIDSGANTLQNFPVLSSYSIGSSGPRPAASGTAPTVTVNATLNSTPSTTFTVHWYFSAATFCTNSQSASSPLVLGRIPGVTTNGSGNAAFTIPLDMPPGVASGVINCTATDAAGNSSEFSACLPVTVTPSISINDISQSEGNSGTTAFTFSVRLSNATTQTVTVNYATANGTAASGSDYQSASGTLTFNPGDTSKSITVLINGDTTNEPNETFLVNLTNATNSIIADGQGAGTILNDDVAPTPKSRKTGVFRPSTGELFLKNSNSSGFADTLIIFGNPGDYPIAGDWNGDGIDSIGIYRNGVFYLRNTNTTGFADIVIPFGSPGDQPVAGDWNGDGVDTIGVYRNGTFYLRNSNTAGAPDLVFTLGNPGDVGIAGDWNGDGLTTCGVFRPSNGIIYLRNSNSTGFADLSFVYGNAGDKPVAGDWNGDGIDTVGIYRNGVFYLTNSNTTGFADIVFVLGNSGDFPIAGNWNGSP